MSVGSADQPQRFEIRRLTPDDLAAYRALHRFALAESPQAFVETPANDAARLDDEVAAMLARGEAWGLLEEGRLMGKVVMEGLPYDCLSHTRWVHAVYVHPDVRGLGAADALIVAAIAQLRSEGVGAIALWVNAENRSARALYERLAFVETGRVPGGIRIGDRFLDDVLMVLTV